MMLTDKTLILILLRVQWMCRNEKLDIRGETIYLTRRCTPKWKSMNVPDIGIRMHIGSFNRKAAEQRVDVQNDEGGVLLFIIVKD